MADIITQTLQRTRVVPLVQTNDPDIAVKIAGALIEGGLTVLEVVLRTDEAMKCLEAIIVKFPEAIVGAGTVLSSEQTKEVIARGAKFVVSPGLDEASVKISQSLGIPIFAGIATPSELQRAWNLGLTTVKFFPASLVGGPKMLTALSSVFRDMRFMPTGGVSAANLTQYLDVPAVLACGGSWLTPQDAIQNGDFAAISKLARETVKISQK